MNNRSGLTVGRMTEIVRRHPGRSSLLVGLVALALVVALLVRHEGGRSTEAGRLEPGGSPTTTATGAITGDEPAHAGPKGGVSPTTGGDPAGDPSSGAATRATAQQPGGAEDDPGSEPVKPRAPVRCEAKGVPGGAPLPPADERDGRRWVTVGRLTGSCDASSTPFQLLGVDTRLAWRSDADFFAVFVVDVVQGRDASAGFSDGQCARPCSESQAIVPAAGRYRLEVQAGDGPWEVEVQEYRRP